MKNNNDNIIYVGKAKNLKKRLSSYFRGQKQGKTKKLVSEIKNFEYIIVENETEALILELNLIKEHSPKYNILMRDDKSYPYIELTDEKVPRLLVVHNLNKRKNLTQTFGPYPNVYAAKKTVHLLNRLYPLRKCRTYPKKPCLYYHIGQCLGYCAFKIEQPKINKMKQEILQFLKGDHKIITEKLTKQMEQESSKLNYEKAKELKELLDYITVTLIKQKVEVKDIVPRDVFSYYYNEEYLSIVVLFIRGGKIIEIHNNIISIVDETKEELTRYIANFYENKFLVPKEILVPNIVNTDLLSKYLKTKVLIPKRGVKKQILEMGNENAKIQLKKQINLIKKEEERTIGANEELKELLKLNKLETIESFDVSHIAGSFNVGCMVYFKNGKPLKKQYRKYKLKINKIDDYNSMKELIKRRYTKLKQQKLNYPDLIIVDGGQNQINATKDILAELNIIIPIIGLKKDEKHRTDKIIINGIEKTINKQSNLFHYLERIQDEVHRFTINYHKQIRSKGMIESILDDVPGIGPKRKQKLLKKYKNLNNIKRADYKELEQILTSKIATNLQNYLKEVENENTNNG